MPSIVRDAVDTGPNAIQSRSLGTSNSGNNHSNLARVAEDDKEREANRGEASQTKLGGKTQVLRGARLVEKAKRKQKMGVGKAKNSLAKERSPQPCSRRQHPSPSTRCRRVPPLGVETRRLPPSRQPHQQLHLLLQIQSWLRH